MKTVIAVIVIANLILVLFGCGKNVVTDSAVPSLLGVWQSVAFDGADVGNFISSIEFSFRETSEFTVVATMTDGSTRRKSGVWSFEKDHITMLTAGETIISRIEWRNGFLVINDPTLDSRAILKKKD